MLNLDVPVLALLLILLLGMLMRLEKSKLVSKPSTLNRFSKSVTRFHIFSPIHAKVQTNKQTNLRSPAGHTRPWITGIGVFVYAATLSSLLHRLTGSCTGLTAGSLMLAGAVLQPTSRQRPLQPL